MRSLNRILLVAFSSVLLLAACTAPPKAQPDLLSTILARGTLVIATDAAYPPQSALRVNPQRTPGTKCTSDQMTLGDLEGFDIDTGAAIAKALGVEPCFATPDWSLVTAGGWSGAWDVSIGSMAITTERVNVLYIAQPYSTSPAALFVHAANTTFAKPPDLDGRTIGILRGSTYESYLEGTLAIPGEPLEFVIHDAKIKEYDDDTLPLEALSAGDGAEVDAVLTSLPVAQRAIASGKPLKQLGEPLFIEYLAPAIDRASARDPNSFVSRVNEVVAALHADGTLTRLSQQWYNLDLTSAATNIDDSQSTHKPSQP